MTKFHAEFGNIWIVQNIELRVPVKQWTIWIFYSFAAGEWSVNIMSWWTPEVIRFWWHLALTFDLDIWPWELLLYFSDKKIAYNLKAADQILMQFGDNAHYMYLVFIRISGLCYRKSVCRL